MSYFDIVETSGKAYITAWKERKYLLTLVLVPFITKAIFYAIVILLGYEENILRKTLIMLPAYIMEGWMIAHITRLIFFGERWPIKLSGNMEADISYVQSRGRAIFASIILYTLIHMIWGLLIFTIIKLFVIENDAVLSNVPEKKEDIPPIAFVISTLMGIGIIWGFKLLFVHLAVSVDISIKSYLERLKGITPSMYFIGACLISYIPFILLENFLLQLLYPLFATSEVYGKILEEFIFLCMHTLAIMLLSICVAIALKHMFRQNTDEGTHENDQNMR